jgi:chemotaxis protein MotB
MALRKKKEEHVNHERWLVSYADFITLLFAFFVVMFSVSQVDSKKVGRFTESFRDALEWEMMQLPGRVGGREAVTALVTPLPHGKRKADDKANSGGNYEDEKVAIRRGLLARAKFNRALAGLNVLEIRGELILRLPERLMFDRGDALMHQEGKSALAAISEELKDRPVRLRVEGHSDNTPIHNARFPSNWELSITRAMAVVAFFLEDAKINPSRLAAAGYGEYHPIAANETPEGRSKNRRVDLIIIADIDARGRPVEMPDDGETR